MTTTRAAENTDHRIDARVVAASVTLAGYRLVTLKVRLPWIILPELLTHRELSRNFTSLRAIPQAKLVAAVREAPFFFAHLGLAQKGMQALEDELEGPERRRALMWWHELAQDAAHYAEQLASLDLHKQVVNRALMPFLYAEGVVSATSRQPWRWPAENFFGVRCKQRSPEPHMHELAWTMADAVAGARWVERAPGDWHLPFIAGDERVARTTTEWAETLADASAMRCARASYARFDGTITGVEEDARDAQQKLAQPGDLHGSPFEHQARVPLLKDLKSGNFTGWEQKRQRMASQYTAFGDADYKIGRVRTLRPGIMIDWKDEVNE